jgi:hypothetical protein
VLGENLGAAIECKSCEVLKDEVLHLREQNEKLISLLSNGIVDAGFEGGESIVDSEAEKEKPQFVKGYTSRRARYAKLSLVSKQKADASEESRHESGAALNSKGTGTTGET